MKSLIDIVQDLFISSLELWSESKLFTVMINPLKPLFSQNCYKDKTVFCWLKT